MVTCVVVCVNVCFCVVVVVSVAGCVVLLLLSGGLSSLRSWLCQCYRQCDGYCMVGKNEMLRRRT